MKRTNTPVVPAERRDPYAVSSRFGTVSDGVRHNQRPGLWVPAFAGTTHTRMACAVLASRHYRPLNLPKADTVAIALAPAAHDQRIAVFEKRPLDAAGKLGRLGTVPADLQQAAALVFFRAGDGAAAQEIADIHGAAA